MHIKLTITFAILTYFSFLVCRYWPISKNPWVDVTQGFFLVVFGIATFASFMF